MGDVDFENVVASMSKFITVFSENYKAGYKNTSWSDHVISYSEDPMAFKVRYEDLLQNTEEEVIRTLEWLGEIPVKPVGEVVRNYKFKVLSTRNPGEEDRQSFYRKGISGDWKNYFNSEALEVFNQYHSEGLRYYKYD